MANFLAYQVLFTTLIYQLMVSQVAGKNARQFGKWISLSMPEFLQGKTNHSFIVILK